MAVKWLEIHVSVFGNSSSDGVLLVTIKFLPAHGTAMAMITLYLHFLLLSSLLCGGLLAFRLQPVQQRFPVQLRSLRPGLVDGSLEPLRASSSPISQVFDKEKAFGSDSSLSTTEDDEMQDVHLNPKQMTYVVLTSIFVTCLIIADVVGVKLFQIPLPFEIFGFKSVEHSCGMLTFPITFVLGDIINEYYGSRAAKNTVYIGLAMSILVFTVMNAAQALPYLDKPFNVSPEAFDTIFGSAKLMYVASVSAYFVGSLADIYLFQVIKRATNGKLLWLRATGSTVISQLLDSFVVSYIAFSLGKTLTGQIPASPTEIIQIACTGYGLKFFLSTLITPLLYVIKGILTQEGMKPLPVGKEEDGKPF